MKKYSFIPALLIVSVLACRSLHPLYKWYNQPVSNVMFQDAGSKNILNGDNIVFRSNRKFFYNYECYARGKKMAGFAIGKNTDSLPADSVSLYDIPVKNHPKNLCKIDYLILSVDSTTGNLSLAKSQSILRYLYQTKSLGTILNPELTGVVEDSSRIFLHPPRSYQFELLELCPFPQVYFPLEISKTWAGKLNVPPGWFRFHSVNDNMLAVNFDYQVVDFREVTTRLGKLKCYQIKATGESALGKSSADYLFSPEFGFVKMEFSDPYDNRIVFNLEKIIN